MEVKESIKQLNSLIEHFNNGGLDFNATDIEATKYLLNGRQELIDYLKEKKKEYIELYNISCDIVAFDRYECLINLCEDILSKIEKE